MQSIGAIAVVGGTAAVVQRERDDWAEPRRTDRP